MFEGVTHRNAAYEIDDDQLIARMREESAKTPLHKLLGFKAIQLDGVEGAILEMPIAENALNTSGNLHGGSIATLIDVTSGTTAALGSTTFVPGKNTLVTADMHVRYLGRARGDYVRAHGRMVRSGKQLIVVECQVIDAEERLVAWASFTSMVVPLREPMRSGDAEGLDL